MVDIEFLCNYRMLLHAQLVQRVMFGCCAMLDGWEYQEVMERAFKHDTSKFSKEMYEATLLADIQDRKARELTVAEKEKLAEWGKKHYEAEFHHPGHFADCNEMGKLDLLEMVADWTAMAVELKNPDLSAKFFADKVIGSRFKFNKENISEIYRLIALADKVVREEKLSGWFDNQ